MIQNIMNNVSPNIKGLDKNLAIQNNENSQGFKDVLKSAIEQVNQAQLDSDQKTTDFANGKIDDLHNVMISAQKASVMLETGVQMQKKVIDAYNEVMRMQI